MEALGDNEPVNEGAVRWKRRAVYTPESSLATEGSTPTGYRVTRYVRNFRGLLIESWASSCKDKNFSSVAHCMSVRRREM